VRGCELYAEAAGDLVAHARVAVLHVVPLRVARSPELVQVTRHRAGRADNDILRSRGVVDRADHRALRRRIVLDRIEARDLRVPVAIQPRGILAIRIVDRPAIEQLRESLERRACVADERNTGMLGGVEVGDVDVDEAYVRISERGLRRGREVRPARADAEYEIRLGGEPVCREGAGDADRPERRGMVV